MEDLSAKRVEDERDGIVSILRTIADRLATLAGREAHESLRQLRHPVTSLVEAAVSVLGPLPADLSEGPAAPSGSTWPTVVFVRRGHDLDS